MRKHAYNLGLRLARIGYVRRAIDDRADLSQFDHRPTVRIVLGVFLIGFSFVICWPAISALGAFSLYIHRPLIGVIGGPILYGSSHLCFIAGMALAGAKYSAIFLRWLTRMSVERLLASGMRNSTTLSLPLPRCEVTTLPRSSTMQTGES